MTTDMIPMTGTVARREYGGTEVARSAETAVSAAAAHAEAQVKAMYSMAVMRPRDTMAVRERLLNECERKGFAAAAVYNIPRAGTSITGPSIRFAEAALRALGNIHVRTSILYDDAERRVGEVTVIDLESNVPLTAGFTVDKTVERRKVNKGDVVLGERVNSSGQQVFRILATEADVMMKQESTVSRLRRNLILQLLPGDIRDEALGQCEATMQREDEKDPSATAKKISDGFYSLGISAAQLREYLGHPVDKVTPDEARALRGVYQALRDGATTWSEVLAERAETKAAGAPATTDEKAEKGRLIGELATARIQRPAEYEAAMKASGVAPGIAASALPIETLRKAVAALSGPAAPAEMDPEVRGFMDQLGAAPSTEEV